MIVRIMNIVMSHTGSEAEKVRVSLVPRSLRVKELGDEARPGGALIITSVHVRHLGTRNGYFFSSS